MDTLTLRGTLLAAVERPYSPFTDAKTGEIRPGGVTYLAYISTGFDAAPVEVKVPVDQFSGLREGGPRPVTADVELRAQNNRIVRRLLAWDEMAAAPPAATRKAA